MIEWYQNLPYYHIIIMNMQYLVGFFSRMDDIRISASKLSVNEASHAVTDPTCGAISLFVGR